MGQRVAAWPPRVARLLQGVAEVAEDGLASLHEVAEADVLEAEPLAGEGVGPGLVSLNTRLIITKLQSDIYPRFGRPEEVGGQSPVLHDSDSR